MLLLLLLLLLWDRAWADGAAVCGGQRTRVCHGVSLLFEALTN
jgi:hypothetical protein